MENASNALLIAGGVLIGVLVLTLAVYLYTSFGIQAQENYDLISEQQLVKFNTQFTKYDGREDLTIYDVVSAISTARANNDKYKDYSDYETEYKITIYIDGASTINKENEDLISQYSKVLDNTDINLNEDIKFEYTFSCGTKNNNIIEYYENGRVKSMRFISKKNNL